LIILKSGYPGGRSHKGNQHVGHSAGVQSKKTKGKEKKKQQNCVLTKQKSTPQSAKQCLLSTDTTLQLIPAASCFWLIDIYTKNKNKKNTK
jgi:hypothetical protein